MSSNEQQRVAWHHNNNTQICDAFKEEWCKNNGFKLIVIRTNTTIYQPVKKCMIDNIAYYDIAREKYKCENGTSIVSNDCLRELDEVIRDIVSNID